MRVNAINDRGSVETQGDVRSRINKPGDIVAIQRGRLRSLVMICPCGCGDNIILNMDTRVGPAWRLYQNSKGLTVFPSVWRESGCQSHFIIWNNKIYWCDYDSLWDDYIDDTNLDAKVLGTLSVGGLIHYKDLAEILNEIPWSVLHSCRRLEKKGVVREGKGNSKGYFQRVGIDLKG